jgi:hypothetical protein
MFINKSDIVDVQTGKEDKAMKNIMNPYVVDQSQRP